MSYETPMHPKFARRLATVYVDKSQRDLANATSFAHRTLMSLEPSELQRVKKEIQQVKRIRGIK